MSTLLEIKELIDKQGEAFAAFKKVNDERVEALKSGNESRAKELDAKLDRIEKDIKEATAKKSELMTELDLQRDRIEELESRAKSPGKTAQDKVRDEYKSTFIDWIRNKGQSPIHEQKLQDLQRKDAISNVIGTPSAGGFAVPQEIAREIERLELLFSPVRRLVKVVQAGSSDYKELVNVRGANSGWVGENGGRSQTDASQLREVKPTFGELYAYPQASEWALDDMFFNVEAWLAEEVAQDFSIKEGDAVIRGDGSSKPTGMLDETPTAEEDFASPLRDQAAYQFVTSTDTSQSPGAAAVTGDSLIDLIYKLRSPYRAGATFVMNSVTAGAVRKIKDANGQYHWQPGLQMGQPDRLLGYPLEMWEQMDDIGNGKFPIFFGNFRRGYVLADRVGLRITRDNVTNVGFVRFYIRRREGGIVLNNDAIKLMKTVNS